MDTEFIKPLASILIWGGLFFLMMRYGCGAHVIAPALYRRIANADKRSLIGRYW